MIIILQKEIVVKFHCFLRKKNNSKKKKFKKIDLSCSPDPCLNEGQCSTRLNRNYHCECLFGFTGINCTNGGFLFCFPSFILFSSLILALSF